MTDQRQLVDAHLRACPCGRHVCRHCEEVVFVRCVWGWTESPPAVCPQCGTPEARPPFCLREPGPTEIPFPRCCCQDGADPSPDERGARRVSMCCPFHNEDEALLDIDPAHGCACTGQVPRHTSAYYAFDLIEAMRPSQVAGRDQTQREVLDQLDAMDEAELLDEAANEGIG